MSSAPQLPASARRRAGHRLAVCLILSTLLGWACAPAISNGQTVAPSPNPSPAPAHAPEIRIGLIGSLGKQNVWALFSGEGYSYNDYAVRARYWPRLYELSVPAQDFEPRLAAGMPTPLRQEGIFYTAIVPIRTDLHWTDGSGFSAQDAAFTIKAALQFELGFDWGAFYDGQTLDHVEAISPDSLALFFKAPPGVQGLQLGVLQGPVVQAEYWAPRVAEAADLLPTPESSARIQALQEKAATLQQDVNRLYAATLTAQGEQARELQADLRRQQGNLDEASNDLLEEQAAIQDALKAARLALFEESDAGEPLLGPWLPSEGPGTLTGVTNLYNSSYPGPRANFDRAAYLLYPSQEAAGRALAADEVNLVLDPTPQPISASVAAMVSPSHSLRFLALNLNSAGLEDAGLRTALACILDQAELAARIGGAVDLPSFIASREPAWHDPEATLPCAGLDAAARLAQAVEMLKASGYTWEREPLEAQSGQGLKRPDGSPVPALRLLAPGADAQRSGAATYIEEQAARLGLPLTTQLVAPDALDYIVYSSGDFDAAVIGWRVGAYPGYLCEWFATGGLFDYNSNRLASLCGELRVSANLEDARGHVYAIEKALAEEIPMIPLYSVAVTDELHGVTYPFGSVMNGLAGVYGALGLAVPAAP